MIGRFCDTGLPLSMFIAAGESHFHALDLSQMTVADDLDGATETSVAALLRSDLENRLASLDFLT